MVKSKRFEPIANLARDSEREAAKALGSALKNLESFDTLPGRLQSAFKFKCQCRYECAKA